MKKIKDDTIQLIGYFLQIKTNKLRKEEEEKTSALLCLIKKWVGFCVHLEKGRQTQN